MNRQAHTYPDGSKYQGELKDGKRHGQGAWLRPDGTKYVGQWFNDRPEGQGTITWPDGKKYVGQWKNGKRHGQGAEISPDGGMVEGEWEEGTFIRETYTESALPFEERPKSRPSRARVAKPDMGSDGKNFFMSLFDISMQEMVTPKIIRVIYIIGLVFIGLGVIGSIIAAIFTVGDSGVLALLGTIIVAPIGALIGIIFLRIYLEIIILLFNIYDQLKEIKSMMRER